MLTTREIIEVSAIALVQVAAIVGYRAWSKKLANKDNNIRANLAKEYPYEGMRNVALNTVPGAIVANVPDDETYVYCVVMDWDMGNDMITLVTQITGDANLYVKSGGGIIGAGKYPGVSNAAQQFTKSAQALLGNAVAVNATPLPQQNCVQFYLLTNKGKFAGVELMQNIENKTSAWTSLFAEATNVIGQMRNAAVSG